MRRQLIAIGLLGILTCIAGIVKVLFLPGNAGGGAFIVPCFFWIGACLVVILAANAIALTAKRSETDRRKAARFNWPNRRDYFRMVYPASLRPRIVIDQLDDRKTRHLDYAVLDISQGGLCFLDDGSFGQAQRLTGRIMFPRGDALRISGRIVRRNGRRLSVQLARNLDWAMILNQQRQLLNETMDAD